MNRVKDLALDVWEDLKRTGLAGVAVGMAITFVAVSAIVLRPGGPPEIQTGYAAADAAPTQEVSFDLPGDEPMKISDIDLSAPRDPFQTLDQIDAGSDVPTASQTSVDTDELTTTSSTGGGGGGGTGTESDATTVSYDDSEALVPLDDLETATTEGTDTNSEPVEESSEARGEVKDDQPPATAPATDYSYAADVQFGIEGSLKRYENVQRLGFVPSRSNPLLMYLGVKADHETAVFMVDSRLSQGGEGTCVPKPSLCTFIEMTTGAAHDEHRFRDADGEEYLLRLRGVVRTTAKAGSLSGGDTSELPDSPAIVDGSR